MYFASLSLSRRLIGLTRSSSASTLIVNQSGRPHGEPRQSDKTNEEGPNFTRTNISFNEMKCREGIFNDRAASSKLGPQLRFMEVKFGAFVQVIKSYIYC